MSMKIGKPGLLVKTRRWFARLWDTVQLKDRYRPEQHYLRGRPSGKAGQRNADRP
jgi:hypothetical protein